MQSGQGYPISKHLNLLVLGCFWWLDQNRSEAWNPHSRFYCAVRCTAVGLTAGPKYSMNAFLAIGSLASKSGESGVSERLVEPFGTSTNRTLSVTASEHSKR
jgi:hypothetical protein